MAGEKRNWVITGGTGFVGRELVFHLLSNSTDHITLLCRNTSDTALKRVEQMLREIDPALVVDWNRIKFLQIDLNKDCLGLALPSLNELKEFDNHFLHLAASTRFTNTLEKARQVNVEGTKNAFNLAKLINDNLTLNRFVYVSTAYVQGHRKDVVGVEEPLDPALARNTYEQSKCEAEMWIRQNRSTLPTVIFRPSIVVGDSNTGRSSGTATIYWAIKMFLNGHNRFFARLDARLDMIPVNYVVEAMIELSVRKDSVNECYPLVSGTRQDQTLAHLAEAVSTELCLPKAIMYRPTIPMRFSRGIRFLASLMGKAKFADQMLAYLPYFSENPRFDHEPTHTALSGTGIVVPVFDDYIGILVRAFAERQGAVTVTHRLASA